jgi:hypothetical protein
MAYCFFEDGGRGDKLRNADGLLVAGQDKFMFPLIELPKDMQIC